MIFRLGSWRDRVASRLPKWMGLYENVRNGVSITAWTQFHIRRR